MKIRENFYSAIVAMVGAILALSAAFVPGWLDPAWVSAVYKPFSRKIGGALASLTGLVPFSVAEFLIYLGISAIVFYVIWTIVRVACRKKPFRTLYRLAANLMLTTGILYFLFSALWGMNYYSLPLARELLLETKPYSFNVLYRTAESFVKELNLLAGEVPRDANGVSDFGEFADLGQQAALSWNHLVRVEGAFQGASLVRPKYVGISEAMSYTGITGIFMPFTYESNVNAVVPDSSLPFTMAHELAHAAGVAPEKEANFAAFLACRQSTDPKFRYSGYLAAFIYSYNAVVQEDRTAAAELWYSLDERILADLIYRSEYWKKYEGQVKTVATKVNNTYLMAMNQAEGIKSYGMVVDLLLADFVRTYGNPDAE